MKKYQVITVLLLVSVFATGCIKAGPKEPSSKLKTYSNEEYAFEFQYPSNWKIYDGINDEGKYFGGVVVTPYDEDYLFNKSDGAFLSIEVNSGDTAKYSIREFLDRFAKSAKLRNPNVEISERTLTIDGKVEAIQSNYINSELFPGDFTSDEAPVVGDSIGVYFKTNNVLYNVLYNYTEVDSLKYKKTFEEIVSSIKLTN